MTADGLKEQFEHYQQVEKHKIEEIKEARFRLLAWRRDRKEAYRKWQAKLKEVR